jgi:hypothetical protein
MWRTAVLNGVIRRYVGGRVGRWPRCGRPDDGRACRGSESLPGCPAGPATPELQAAEPDAEQDGHAAGHLRRADRVPEQHRARDRANERLQVEERARHVR